MLKIEVINIKTYESDDYVYIGRPSDFGNPYSSKEKSIAEYKVDSKKESISKYREHIIENVDILDSLISELNSKGYNKIGCFCKPSGCHGDVLKELIEERTTKSIF
jgi:cobalamin biosynthesis Mg chelatase CobN